MSGSTSLLGCSIIDLIAQYTFSDNDALHKYWLVFQVPDTQPL